MPGKGLVMQLRCPYPETRELPWFGRLVEPDEVVDIPDDLVENFLAAGWKSPDEPVVWPPEPPAPPADAVPPEQAAPPTRPEPPAKLAAEPPPADEGQAAQPEKADTTTTSKRGR